MHAATQHRRPPLLRLLRTSGMPGLRSKVAAPHRSGGKQQQQQQLKVACKSFKQLACCRRVHLGMQHQTLQQRLRPSPQP